MMAAEVNEPTSVEAPALSSSDAVHKINDNSQNGGSRPPSVTASGSPDELANKHIADIVDDLLNSAEPSISGGSDTETSRRDTTKGSDGDSGHARTSSTARKPATFKTVSVNKTFLAAKAAAGSSSTPKSGDTASPVLGNASLSSSSVAGSARPRLVAKTGLVKGVSTNGRPAAAPDPNVVWNKNRPVPPPEPRKLTDEELKKYGIHVATRLQQDDTKGQANNWADIDDDDEDWAPEEITWTDGTKSTIPHHEEQHQLSQLPNDNLYELTHHQPQATSAQPSPLVPEAAVSRDVAMDEKPRSPAPTGVRTGGLPSGKGLIFRGAPERPTLVAKPPAPPTPVKSPWAQLPPVDKAPPVAGDMQQYTANSRMPYQQPPPQHYHQHQHRDVYGGPPRGSTPPPHHYKEIAADDFSRSGFRDGHQHMNRELFNSQSGRLEPVGDRRGSFRNDNMHYRQPPSTVLQRPAHSMDQQPEPSSAFQTHRSSGQEGPYGRRRNSSNVSGGSGSYMQRMGRPHDQHVPTELLNARRPSMTGRSDSPASPNFSPSVPHPWQTRGSPNTSFAGPHSNVQPPNAAQHSANQQGVPSPIPVHAQAVPLSSTNTPLVTAIDDVELQKKIMRERLEAAKKRRVEEEEREEAAKRERIRLKLEAMGPAPERKSAKKEATKEEASTATAAAPSTPAQSYAKLNASGEERTPPEKLRKALQPKASAHGDISATGAAGPESEQHGQQAQHDQQQPWHGPASPQTERIASWGSSNQSMRNVWGSPNNRSLGNGTFISDLGRVNDPYAQKGGPGPIGPPPAPIGPPKIAALAAATVPSQGPAASPPAAAAPANVTRSAWANAVKAGDESLLAQQKAHRAEQQRDAEARGLTLNDIRPTIKDTWMPTRLSEDGNRVEDKANQSVVHRAGTTVAVSTTPTPPIHPQQARPSRFFPAREARADDSPAMGSPVAPNSSSMPSNGVHDRPGSPSPPPPDMDGHPAFDGDASHPLVSLPRPQIVVRLPPKNNHLAAVEPLYSHHAQTRPSAAPLNAEDGHWQAKFDSLLKLGSSAKSSWGAARPDAHSRHPVDATSPATSPTSLYTTSKGPAAGYIQHVPNEPVMTRPMAEECFERQEMGSLPPVHLPNKAPELAWTPASAPKSVPRRFQIAAMTSSDYESVIQDLFSPLHSVNIHLPGMAGSGKIVTLPTPRSLSNRSLSNPRRSGLGRNGGRHGGPSHRGGSSKSRDTASTHSGSHGNDNGPAPSSSHGSTSGRSRGGGMRHRSENWSRGKPASVLT